MIKCKAFHRFVLLVIMLSFQGDSYKVGIHPMEDARYFYVYENQRWNPLTGFTSHGLPTDRYKNF